MHLVTVFDEVGDGAKVFDKSNIRNTCNYDMVRLVQCVVYTIRAELSRSWKRSIRVQVLLDIQKLFQGCTMIIEEFLPKRVYESLIAALFVRSHQHHGTPYFFSHTPTEWCQQGTSCTKQSLAQLQSEGAVHALCAPRDQLARSAHDCEFHPPQCDLARMNGIEQVHLYRRLT